MFENDDTTSSTENGHKVEIWARLSFLDGNRFMGSNFSSSWEGNMVDLVRRHLCQKHQEHRRGKVWKLLYRNFVHSVAQDMVPPTHGRRNDKNLEEVSMNDVADNSLSFERIFQLQSTPDQVTVNLTRLCTVAALNLDETDEAEIEHYYSLAHDKCMPKITKEDVTEEFRPGSLEWLSRPFWAWNWRDRLLLQAMILSRDLMDEIASQTTKRAFISIWTVTNRKETMQGQECTDSNRTSQHISHDATVDTSKISAEVDDLNDLKFHGSALFDKCCSPTSCAENNCANCKYDSTLLTISAPDKQSDLEREEDGTSMTLDTPRAVHGTVVQEESEATKSSQEHSNDRDETTIFTTTEHSPKTVSPSQTPPRYDSNGFDISVLSQLPASLRSQVRMDMVIQEREKRKTNQSSGIRRWLSQGGDNPMVGTGRPKRNADKPAIIRRSKKCQTIEDFLLSQDLRNS